MENSKPKRFNSPKLFSLYDNIVDLIYYPFNEDFV